MIYACPDSIPADGSREVSKDLNDWIASVPTGDDTDTLSTLVFERDSVYWVDGTITVTGKKAFEIAGQGARFVRRNQLPGSKSDVRGRAHWRFTDCASFDITGVRVEGQANPPYGYNSALEAQHGFSFLSCKDGNVIDCSVKDVWGDGFNFACDSSYAPTARIQVLECESGCVLRDSVSLTFADSISFDDCRFGHSWRSGVDMEPNADFWKVTNITFQDCSWQSHRLNWLAAGNTNTPGIVSDVTMRRCVSRHLSTGVACDLSKGSRSNFTIDSCVGHETNGGPSGANINFQNTSGFVTVTNNVQPLTAGRIPPMRVARFDDYTATNATITYEGNTEDLG